MREAKHQVASFELEDGSRTIMNHLVAVKQYSRSSADQESPLPHELRPEPVLKMTMTYLLQNIMDLCDVPDTNVSDWFHFLWDRTRSIRKDITQQELCSPGSVLLVEQCARFHIHCAARLVAEEPQVFDQKINTENLTKCLQSLKYMYHDLELKMVRCPNEAEFRAYVVLLNLHNANFLWEVKQLRPEILNSPEVRYAISVYLAMESNNYVKFFALVRSTTYMNACILLRYFTQVRVKALTIMLKAYVARAPVILSISNLTYTLAFEDADQCTQFLEYYGLMCDGDDVRLDRSTFFYPDVPFIMDRAINVIEHKRHSSVGDAVYGGTLDPKDVLEKYEPHDSFNENGYLLPKAWTADDQDFFRPQAKIEARLKSPHVPFASAEDEGVFKIPTSLPPPRQSISPKLRLSPKTVPSEAATNGKPGPSTLTSAATPNIFGSGLTTNQKATENIFKAPVASSANNIFGGFSSQNSGATTASTSKLFQMPAATPNDTLDGRQQFSADIFSKPAPSTSNNIFSSSASFGQPIFGESPKPATSTPSQSGASIFGQQRNLTPASDIFGGNFGTSQQQFSRPAQPSLADSSFKPAATSSSSIFGGFKDNFSPIAGIAPLATQTIDPEIKRLEQEKALLLKLKAEADEKKETEKRRKEEADREHKRKVKEIETASVKISADISDEVVLNTLRDLVGKEIERHRAIEQKIQNIYTDLVHEVIKCRLQKIADEVKTAWNKNILDKYFALWRSVTRKSIEQRRKIENTPVWLPSKTMPELVSELFNPMQRETLKLMKRYRSGVPEKLEVSPIREDKINVWSEVTPPLIQLFTSTRREQQHRRKLQLINANIYWKCVISVPDADEDASHRTINSWLNNVFKRQYPRDNRYFFAEQSTIGDQHINICMRKLCGTKLHTESQQIAAEEDFRGTNAVLFFVTTRNMHVARARLEAVLRMTSLHDATGLVVYNMGNIETAAIQKELRLSEFIDIERIDDCVFSSQAQRSLANRTENCLRYIASNSFYENQLQMQQTASLLRQCLAADFWQRIHATIEQNPTLGEAATDVKFLTQYYNEAIDRMISICTPSTESHAEFPDELRKFVPTQRLDIPLDLEYFPVDWKAKCEEHQQQLKMFLQSARIRDTINVKRITDVQELEQEVLRFTRSHLPNDDRTAYKLLQQILMYIGPHPLDRIAFQEKLARYNWIDCLPVFTIDLLAAKHDQHRLPEYTIYDRDEYEEYTRTTWWLSLNQNQLRELTRKVIRDTDLEIDRLDQQRKRQKIDVRTLAEQEQKEIDAALAMGMASLEKADRVLRAMRESEMANKSIARDLDCSLYRHIGMNERQHHA